MAARSSSLSPFVDTLSKGIMQANPLSYCMLFTESLHAIYIEPLSYFMNSRCRDVRDNFEVISKTKVVIKSKASWNLVTRTQCQPKHGRSVFFLLLLLSALPHLFSRSFCCARTHPATHTTHEGPNMLFHVLLTRAHSLVLKDE